MNKHSFLALQLSDSRQTFPMACIFIVLLLLVSPQVKAEQTALYAFPNEEGLFGYVTKDGKWAIPTVLSEANEFKDGLALVRYAHGDFAVIKSNGEIVAQRFLENEHGVSWNSRFVMFPDQDIASKKHIYDWHRNAFVDMPASPHKIGKHCPDGKTFWYKSESFTVAYGWIDEQGNVSKDFGSVREAHCFVEGLALAKRKISGEDYWGLLKPDNEWFLDPGDTKWQKAKGYSEDLLNVQVGDKTQYVDRKGKVQIEGEWLQSKPFSEGLAAVYVGGEKVKESAGGLGLTRTRIRNGKWGFIDKTGKMVIEPQFDEVDSFYNGQAAVAINHLWAFIDNTGKQRFEPKYRSLTRVDKGAALATDDALNSLVVNINGMQLARRFTTPEQRGDMYFGYLDQPCGENTCQEPVLFDEFGSMKKANRSGSTAFLRSELQGAIKAKDLAKVQNLTTTLEQLKNGVGHFVLFEIYRDGHLAPKDEQKAWEHLNKAYALKHRAAVGYLGAMTLNNPQQKAKHSEAIRAINYAANKGYNIAMTQLAGIYFQGKGGVKADEKLGVLWLNRAAKSGDVSAMTEMGLVHYKGKYGHPVFFKRAAIFLMPACQRGSHVACLNMGDLANEQANQLAKSNSSQNYMEILKFREQAKFMWSRAEELGNTDAKSRKRQ